MSNVFNWVILFTGLTYLKDVQSVIDVETDCDLILNLYADGVDVNSNKKGTTQSLNTSIPDDTKVVAVTCQHTDGPAGMRLAFSTSITTGHSWKCNNKFVDGWYEPGFNDDAWSNAAVVKDDWIWTANSPQDDTVYCRRVIALEAISAVAACNNIMQVYVDGVLYKNGNNSYWGQPATISMPGNTQLFAIKCRNTDGPAGIKVTLSNGVETSAEWKCYNKHEQGWNGPGFNDDTWPNAVVVSGEWIWTAGYPQDDIVYCRKFFGNRTVVDSDNSSGLSCLEFTGVAAGLGTTVSLIIIILVISYHRRCIGEDGYVRLKCCRLKCRVWKLLVITNLLGALAIGLATYYMCKQPISTGWMIFVDLGIGFCERILDALISFWARKSSKKPSNRPSRDPSNHPSDDPPSYEPPSYEPPSYEIHPPKERPSPESTRVNMKKFAFEMIRKIPSYFKKDSEDN